MRTSVLHATAWAGSVCALIALSTGCGAAVQLGDVVVHGDTRELRQRGKEAPESSPDRPALLILALDGVDRSLLYGLLRDGELPSLSALLGGDHGKLPHAHLDETLLSTLPSSTLAAWTTAMTGVTPAEHGIAGNEFFVRETCTLAAPAPVSFSDSEPTLAIYTKDYLGSFLSAPSVYERMRARDPHVLIWVAVHQIFAGADRLLITKPTILAHAFEQIIEDAGSRLTGHKSDPGAYRKLDESVVSGVLGDLEKGPVPDVLTLYLSGTDLYAHVAEEGPDEARRTYLRTVVDPALGKLTERLKARGALDNRYVVLTSDHGHTQVVYDDAHALSTTGDDDPPALVRKAGYRLRPFKLNVAKDHDFNAVFASGGAMAYVYVADRSMCPKEKDVCNWQRPPRYEEDVIPMAEAFYRNNEDGSLVPAMKGTLDLILTRRPKPYLDVDLPFEVYVGNGKTVPVGEYLAAHPHPTYVAVEQRLRDLAVGKHGERAGDVLLLAHNGDRATPDERYYFAARYRSWHGSPSRQDSEVPFIVAHPHRDSASLRAQVERILGPEPRQQKVTDVLLELREGKP
jgi:hypothetical protein